MSIYEKEQSKYFYSRVSAAEIAADQVGLFGGAETCGDLVERFYKLSNSNIKFKFSDSQLYRDGRILPMDLSSGLTIKLLEIRAEDHVLDLCCAPGGKLVLAAMIGSGIGTFDTGVPELNGTVTGVDLASHRLATCRSLVKKYKVPKVRLFCADGTRFAEPVRYFVRPESISREAETQKDREKEKESISASLFHETTDFRKRPTKFMPSTLNCYDKVLVDAQCTHDGSIKHIQKHAKNSWKGFDLSQFEEANLEELYSLQYRLLENGFRMLKEGGVLIYSTCSLSPAQNETITDKFLEEYSENVVLLPFEGSNSRGQMRLQPPEFDSGFFIFRVGKKLYKM